MGTFSCFFRPKTIRLFGLRYEKESNLPKYPHVMDPWKTLGFLTNVIVCGGGEWGLVSTCCIIFMVYMMAIDVLLSVTIVQNQQMRTLVQMTKKMSSPYTVQQRSPSTHPAYDLVNFWRLEANDSRYWYWTVQCY